LAIIALALVLSSCGPKPTPAAKAGPAPVAALLRGQHLEGKVVLVEYGTVGCPLSDSCLTVMTGWHSAGTIPGLAFLRLEAIADQATYDGYYRGRSVPFPVVRDPQSEYGTALGTTVFPSFALLDKFGRVRYRGNLPDSGRLTTWVALLQAETADAGPQAPLFGAETTVSEALLASTRLPDLAGSVRPLSGHLSRNGLLLVFADTRCPFSTRAAAELPVVAAGLAAHEVATVLVNCGEPAAVVSRSYGSGIAGTTVVFDTSNRTMQCWNVQFVPTVLLLDSAGTTLYRGSPVWADVAQALERGLGLAAGMVRLDAQGTSGG
jgi:hypothetical protein